MQARKLTDPLAWAQETFGAAQLGDPRRTRRLGRVAAQVAADPQGSLPREMGGDCAARSRGLPLDARRGSDP
jgi:hypothetical protein